SSASYIFAIELSRSLSTGHAHGDENRSTLVAAVFRVHDRFESEIGAALLVAAYMVNWYRPRIVTEQPSRPSSAPRAFCEPGHGSEITRVQPQQECGCSPSARRNVRFRTEPLTPSLGSDFFSDLFIEFVPASRFNGSGGICFACQTGR